VDRWRGWVDSSGHPDEAARMLERFSREQKFVGVRHLISLTLVDGPQR
jgi:hypothetical protein